MIGLARRAGRVVIGGDGVLSAVRSKKACLVILARDASDGTVKRITAKCESFGVPIIKCGTKQSLGSITGRGEAASIAVTDINFADGLRRISEEINGGVCNGKN